MSVEDTNLFRAFVCSRLMSKTGFKNKLIAMLESDPRNYKK